MKRTALLLAILAAFSITSVTQVCASPIAGEKAVTVSNWLSCYFAYFMRAHCQNLGYEERAIGDDGNDVMLRGDADDYANGRDDGKSVNPKSLSDDKLSTGLASPGGLITGSGEFRTKY